ncbi:MAG: zinc ABC transporter substrate-binding protein [Planctomycetes bacterium]|nr:zinc ABC transporter substrate-binding protein [Planctomycetota bacterium]
MRQLLRSGLFLALALAARAQHPVVAATPDVGALCRAIGGNLVEVTVLARAAEDPHFVDARPSMLRACSRAELLVTTGRELEIGWLPVLVGNSRNGRIAPGQPGYVDTAAAVRALGVPAVGTDRSAGDVHAAGNPHYLSDPLCGLQVAALLRDRFAARWPESADAFAANFAAFRARLAVAMVGAELAQAYDHDAERLALVFAAGRLADVLREHGDAGRLGGWFARLAPLRGRAVVADHDLWPYFAERCGLSMVGFFEPRPGIAPTTAHLQELIGRMQQAKATAILSVPYFAPQHAELVARATGARIAAMAHQPGAVPGTDDYVDWIDHNLRAVAAALDGAASAER